MKPNSDNVLMNLRYKSQLSRWRILAVIAIVALIVISIEASGKFNSNVAATNLGADYIARITITDFIYDDFDLLENLQRIEENNKIKALIVWIDTPGGSAVGGEEIYHALRKIAQKKPVVSVMRSMATSAGYMIAIGSDYIIAREGTITGSIGVILQTAEITDLAEKLGINPITIKSSPLKGSPSLFEEPSPEAIASLKVMLDSFYHSFVKLVASRRPFSLEKAYELSDGRVFSGRQALELQLIDEIGGEESAVKWLNEKKKIDSKLEIKDADAKSQHMEFFEKLAETASRKFFNSSASSLDGLRLIWHPSL